MAVTRLFGIFTRLSITFDSAARFQNVTKNTEMYSVQDTSIQILYLKYVCMYECNLSASRGDYPSNDIKSD